MTVINNELGNRLDGLKDAIRGLTGWNPQWSNEVIDFNLMMDRIDRMKEDFGLIHHYDSHVMEYYQHLDFFTGEIVREVKA
jgi:hypothetical protein